MRNNETGEYEMVVGNRQLLSGFLIVVFICGVAFAMGYVVGENSHSPKVMQAAGPLATPPTSSTSASSTSAPERDPYTVPPTGSLIPAVESSQSSSTRAASPAGGEVLPQPSTHAAEPPAAEMTRPTTRPARDVQPETPAPAPVRAPAPPAEITAEPPAGSYWQITATSNHKAAEDLLGTLKDKGFPAMLTAGPNNLTRVLVGPFSDTKALGKAKTDLEGAGFTHLLRK